MCVMGVSILNYVMTPLPLCCHDDVMKWKHFPRHWPFVQGIHRSPVNSTHTCQWRGALLFSLICSWIHDWVNNREAGDMRSRRADYDVTVMTACNNMFSNMNMSKLIILCKCNSSCKDLMVTISSMLIYQISDFGTSDRNNYWWYLLIPQVDIGDKENNNSSDI